MDVWDAIEKRRTIRGFVRGIPMDLLKKILLAGCKAPSSWNRQPWEFILIEDTRIIEQLADYKYQQNRKIPPIHYGKEFTQEDVEKRAIKQKNSYKNCNVVAVCFRKGPELSESTWMGIENMALAATAEDLGIIPSSFWNREYREKVEGLLDIPPGYELATVLLIGVQEKDTDGYPARVRRQEFSWLHKNRFGYLITDK